MTTDIRLAFAHPIERAHAMADDHAAPPDRISLRDHIVEVDIGAFQAERGVPQRICFNVVVEVAPAGEPLEDDVDRILSYDRVTEAIAAELAAERLNLLETLAARIAERILSAPQALRVFVRIEKLDRGPGALGVEIVRSRADIAPAAAPEARPDPLVVYLDATALAASHLPGWIDQLEAQGRPLILCVGPHGLACPRTGEPHTQRRIDLLAVEQTAWTLAARDARCVVVATRTELDWAIRNGQISVWAPSKIVLDAVEGPDPGHRAAADLAGWLAGLIGAAELWSIGSEAPADPPIPMRRIAADQASV